MATIQEELTAFVNEIFLEGADTGNITPEASFMNTGIIDVGESFGTATGILELVMFLEEKYSTLAVSDEEIVPENFDSISGIISFLRSKGIKTI
ncbi:MAG: acyl carrier protein [bacterium]|nr:acyl carrier protein [bacterium]